MGAIKRNIPNFITCLNLACGCIGLVFIFQGKPVWAVYAVFIAAVFDFLDGLIARLLKVTSPIGKDLDSLADVVTFGVLPGMMMYHLIGIYGYYHIVTPHTAFSAGDVGHYVSYHGFAAMLIPVFSAIRLAKFNNDKEQGFYFKGLATPACGLFITCFFYWINKELEGLLFTYPRVELNTNGSFLIPGHIKFMLHPAFLISLIVVLSLLLVSNLKLMAFKFKGFGWKANQWKYILLILCLPLVIFLGFASAPIILILYIILSQIHFRTQAHEI